MGPCVFFSVTNRDSFEKHIGKILFGEVKATMNMSSEHYAKLSKCVIICL